MVERLAQKPTKPAATDAKRRIPRAGRPTTVLITRRAAAEAALSMIDLNRLEALSLQSVAPCTRGQRAVALSSFPQQGRVANARRAWLVAGGWFSTGNLVFRLGRAYNRAQSCDASRHAAAPFTLRPRDPARPAIRIP